MSNLFSDAFKADVRSAIDCVHESFAYDVILFHETVQNYTSSMVNNNPIFGRSATTVSSVPEVSETTIQARVKYLGTQDQDFFSFGNKINLEKSEGIVRLKVKTSDSNSVKTSKNVKVNNELYHVISDPYKTGPWPEERDTDYYIYYLQRSD
tara:strand:+ start:35653 stop:36108 length:456 start_codon:yes stop_codon:yes gene_type:complete